MKPETQWFAVRTIYKFGKKKNGRNIYEERIVTFSGINLDEIWHKAEIEANEYSLHLRYNGKLKYITTMAYLQDGDKLIDGYEVWSCQYESNYPIRKFIKQKYDVFEYNPD